MSFDLSLARGLDYYTGLIYEAVVEGSAPPSQLAPAATAPAPALASSSPSAPPPKKSKKQKAAAAAASSAADGEPEVDESTIGVGSIAAGGRYDELVGMFASAASAEGSTSKNVAKSSIPCVGVSVGVERVFSILLAREKEKAAAKEGAGKGAGRKNATEVYVMSVGEGLLLERMQIAKELWAAGIKVRFHSALRSFRDILSSPPDGRLIY